MFHGRHGRAPLIGPAEGLLPLHGSTSDEITSPAGSSFTTYLDGSVQETRSRFRPRREWQLQVSSAYPEHVQALRQLNAGLLGRPPWVWYDEAAQVVNLLSPHQSMLEEGTWSSTGPAPTGPAAEGGAGTAPDGTFYGRSIVGSPASVVRFFQDTEGLLPVPGSFPVSASVYATSFSASLGVFEVDEVDVQGGVVATHHQTIPAGVAQQRTHVSFEAAYQTRGLRMRTSGLSMTALPAVTLTTSPTPWAEGRGCRKATVLLAGESVQKATPHERGRRIGYSMTVRETG